MKTEPTELQAAIERVKARIDSGHYRLKAAHEFEVGDIEHVLDAATQSLALQQIEKSDVLVQLEALAESLDEQDRLTSRNIVHGAISYILALQQANAELLKAQEDVCE